MTLEIFTNQAKVNIKDLVLEEPQRPLNLPFSPERDLTGVDWNGIKEDFRSRSDEESWEECAELVKAVKIFYPQRISELGNGLKRTVGFLTAKVASMDQGDFEPDPEVGMGTLDEVATARIICPENLEDLHQSYQNLWGKELNFLEYLLAREEEESSIPTFLFNLILAFPEPELRGYFQLNDRTRALFQNTIDDLKGKTDEYSSGNLVKTLALTRVLFPDSKPTISANDWQQMNERLEFLRSGAISSGYWTQFAEYAANMTLLAAEQVEITKEGLEIVMADTKGSFQKGTPSLPDVRRF